MKRTKFYHGGSVAPNDTIMLLAFGESSYRVNKSDKVPAALSLFIFGQLAVAQ
ncbi:MAG: hypothetical protein AAF960_01050 [Bacteroidota bacterium]